MSFEQREKILGFLLLILVSILYFFANLQKVVVPGSVFNELQQIFNCDAGSVTGLGAGFMYVYSLNQLTVGVLADRYSGTRVIMAGGALFCIGSLLSAYSGSLAVLMFSRILTGFGASVIYLSMLKLIFRIARENFTVVMGIIMIIGYSGSIVSGAPFVKFVNAFGYSKCMLTVGIVTVVCY
ncbi:MAG: MFS transporter, partial [Lentisphaeria bacterium]|nr:MFS transporter [Lentisphaeria bacterium]